MSIFYIIFMLLLFVLPSVFKTIEKSLSNAGQDSRARQVKRMSEVLFEEEKDDSIPLPDRNSGSPVSSSYEGEVFPVFDYISDETEQVSEPVEVLQPVSVPKELLEGGYMSVREIAEKRRASQDMRNAVPSEQRKAGKIDPKKLVLYSEIMKTKF